MLHKINWDQFKVKNENYRKSFEDLCYYLFCRKYGKAEGIRVDYNQVGLETHPIYDKNENKWIGFQSKFFENKLSDGSSIKQIKDSINKAKINYEKLDKIIIYTHHSFGSKNPNYKQEIEKNAGKIEIEWFVESNFKVSLFEPLNLDVAQLYFGLGDEFSFIRKSTNPEILTFILSSEYLELPFKDKNKKIVKDIKSNILSLDGKNEFLITGHPGSGKTIFIHKLLQEFGGLDKEEKNGMLKVFKTNKAVPMLINLKNCATDSLENILRERQDENKVRNNKLGFIYLFDGLDELNEDRADSVLSYIQELKQRSNTKKIVISCRTGNFNNTKTKVYLPDITEYQIDDLNEEYITKYFKSKGNLNKNEQLERLKKGDADLLKEVKDILLIKLLWDTINKLDERSIILDLLDKKIALLLNDPKHRKNIEELNLPNPKKEEVIELYKDISFEFHKKFQFRFPQKDLQELILRKFSRLDYKSVNVILNYLADLFFENTYFDSNRDQTFIYQHRIYQEYFFAQKLKSEYEKNLKILRNLNVLSNHDFFEGFFLTYLRQEYKKEKNLAGLIELNLIDVYLGKHRGFGVDDAYYINSIKFIPSLAFQKDSIFEQLFSDNNLKIVEKISFDLEEIKRQFNEWNKNKNEFYAIQYLKDIWEQGIASQLENIVIFWKAGKKDIAQRLLKDLGNIIGLFDKYNFEKNLHEHNRLDDPFWKQWKDLLYIRIIIKGEKIIDIFNNLIRDQYEIFSQVQQYWYKKSEKGKLIESFFQICLKEKQNELFKLIKDFDDFEFIAFLNVLSSPDYLPIFIREKCIHNEIKTFLQNFSQKSKDMNYSILFAKKFFNILLSRKEIEFANGKLSELDKKDSFDWNYHDLHIKFALFSYILEKYSFEGLLDTSEGYSIQFYEETKMYAALYKDYIDLLQARKSFEKIVSDYLKYINNNDKNINRINLKVAISFLWAYIFSTLSRSDSGDIFNLKNRLISEDNNIIIFSFYSKLNRLNIGLYIQLINESDLEEFEVELNKWEDDFPSYVDRCFDLSIFYADINKHKSISYISKGINEGILRHGWRKDHIVSVLLVESLNILWRNNLGTKKELREYTKIVFDLAMRVSEITDGKGTWYGPYDVVEMVSRYDIKLAVELKDLIIKKKGYRNYHNTVISSVLLSQVNLGTPIEDIEKGMEEFRKDYRNDRVPLSDYYEEKFTVYLEIAQCDLYSESEKEQAFEKAYEQVENVNKEKVEFFLLHEYEKEKTEFIELCKQYKKKCNILLDDKKEDIHITLKYTENEFVLEVINAESKQKIRGLYKILDNYNNGIVLQKNESWIILVNKTYEIYGNIKLFIDYMKKNSFPHTDFYTSNSRYLHFGLAASLNDINIHQETLEYLFHNSGHGGFLNVMRAFEINKDKDECLKLFKRYIKFCDFLVN